MPATYTPATIQRCQTILANAGVSAPQQDTREFLAALLASVQPVTPVAAKPQPVRKAAVKADPNAWRSRKPSRKQITRNRAILRSINALESVLGYRHSTIDSLGVKGPSAGAYSDAYKVMVRLQKSLRAERRNMGL